MLNFLSNLGKSKEEKRQEAITAYLDDALTPQKRERFEQEMRADTALRAEVEQQRQIKENMRQLPRQRAPRNFSLDPAMYGRPARAPMLYPALRTATVLVGIFFVIAVVANMLTFSGSVIPTLADFSEAEVAQELARDVAQPEMEMAAPAAPALGESVADEALEEGLAANQEFFEAPAEALEEVAEEATEVIAEAEAEESMPEESIVGDEITAESDAAALAEEPAQQAAEPESDGLLLPSEAESLGTVAAGAALPTATLAVLATPPAFEESAAEPLPPADDTALDRSVLPATLTPLSTAEASPSLDATEKVQPTQPSLAQALEDEPADADQSVLEAAEQLPVEGRQSLPLLRVLVVILAVAVIGLSGVTLIVRSRQ